MPRDVFPYEPDRETIKAFLSGEPSSWTVARKLSDQTSLFIDKNVLMGHSDERYLWFDSAGAVTTVVDGPVAKNIANYVLTQMGASERVTVELHEVEAGQHVTAHRVRYFFDGVPADVAPFVLVGPMTLMAWRADNGFKLSGKARRK